MSSNRGERGRGTRGVGRGRGSSRGGRGKRGGSAPPSTTLSPEKPTHDQSLVDIGANLTKKNFKADIRSVLQRCVDTNVNYIIITGTDESNSVEAVHFAQRYNRDFPKLHIYSTVGIHPHDAKTVDENTISRLEKLILNEKNKGVVCAVGETGLDFNRMFSPQEVQEEAFRKHISLALKHNLPMFLHERDAHSAFVKILGEFDKLPPIVVHCFTGNKVECKKYADMGFYIGFTACICKEDRGRHLRELLAENIVPLEKLMIETDAPFMSPSYSIQRMEPCYLYHVVKTLSTVFNKSEEDIARITTENAKRFFRLEH